MLFAWSRLCAARYVYTCISRLCAARYIYICISGLCAARYIYIYISGLCAARWVIMGSVLRDEPWATGVAKGRATH